MKHCALFFCFVCLTLATSLAGCSTAVSQAEASVASISEIMDDGDSVRVHRILAGGVANAFLIETEDGLVLVDAGPPLSERQILDKMDELGRDDLKLIFITHAHIDHYGAASAIRAVTDAPIAIHAADAEAMANGETRLGSVRYLPDRVVDRVLPALEANVHIRPTEADVLLADGDRLEEYGLDAYVLHLPGHTPGSAGLIMEDRLAFVGDLVSTAGGIRVQRSYADNWAQVRESVERLWEIGPTTVYTGHGADPLSLEELTSLTALR